MLEAAATKPFWCLTVDVDEVQVHCTSKKDVPPLGKSSINIFLSVQAS